MFTSRFRPVALPNIPECGMTYVEWQNSSHTPRNAITTATLKYSYSCGSCDMMERTSNRGKMPILICNEPITDTKRMGGAGFDGTPNEYGIRGDGESCSDIRTSGPNFKGIFLVHARWPNFPFFHWPFSRKTIFLLQTTPVHLPAPADYGRPTHKHKPRRPSSKPRVDPTPRKPHTQMTSQNCVLI